MTRTISTPDGRRGHWAWSMLVLAMLLLASPSLAQQKAPPDAARIAAARELIAAQGGIDQANKALAQMTKALVEQVRRMSPSEADGLERFMKAYVAPDNPKVAKYFETILEASVMFYAERCTLDELKALTEFLRSPAGKKFVAITPDLAASIAPQMVEFQQGLMADIQAAAQRGEFKK